MKTTGEVWAAYLKSWPDGQYMDDTEIHVNGVLSEDDPSPSDVVEVKYGSVYKVGIDQDPKSLVRHFAAWEKALTVKTVICKIPKENMEKFKSMLKSLKGVVLE